MNTTAKCGRAMNPKFLTEPARHNLPDINSPAFLAFLMENRERRTAVRRAMQIATATKRKRKSISQGASATTASRKGTRSTGRDSNVTGWDASATTKGSRSRTKRKRKAKDATATAKE